MTMDNSQASTSEVYRAPAFADFKHELSAPGPTPERLAHLREHGFVIINDFVGNPWIPILREAGRRVTQACAPENVYDVINCSKGYVHRAGEELTSGLRGLFISFHDRTSLVLRIPGLWFVILDGCEA